MEDNLHDAYQQEDSYAHAHRADQQRSVHHGFHLVGQNRQIRFGYGDQKPHRKAHGEENAHLLGGSEPLADVLAHRGHCHIGPQVEKADTDNQQEGACHEYEELLRGDVHPRGDGEDKNQETYRHH